MGVQLGPSFPNALPLSEARRDPRRSSLYRTLVRSPLVAPEALGQYPRRILTRPTATASSLFPRGYTAPGGGISVEVPGVSVRVEETTEEKIRRWLEEETFWEGVANKWFLLGGVIWWLKGRKG